MLSDIRIIKQKRFIDDRGFFVETYNQNLFSEIGIDKDFVQDNFSYSKYKGTVRGLHFQNPPFCTS